MPIFDHRCKSCGHIWEAFVHRSSPNPPCPKCNGSTEHVLVPSSHAPGFRLRTAAEIKKRVTGDIRKLNERLLTVANALAIALQKHEIAKTPQGRILVALFKKAVNTFRAIQLLKSQRLIEEAWVLLRVLLEAHINLIYFVKNDGTELTRRWSDAAILEKLKYLKEVDFFEGTELAHMASRAEWEEKESQIIERYTKQELQALKHKGYSGLSVQQRADAIGLGGMYSNCYRIASRSVHTFDPAETGIMDYVKDGQTKTDLLTSRREMLESTQNMLLGRLAILLNEIIEDPEVSVQLMLLGLGYEKYRDARDGHSTTESDADPGTFYIWRE